MRIMLFELQMLDEICTWMVLFECQVLDTTCNLNIHN
jgi:hypothetical protein